MRIAYKEGNDVSNVLIQDHTIFSLNTVVISNIAGLHNLPLPSDLPSKVIPQTFFIKMAAKDVKETA